MVVVQAPAKLNLTLDIVGRRADGYHLIESVMQSIDLSDFVTLAVASDGGAPAGVGGSDDAAAPSVRLVGNGVDADGVPVDENNLASRAVQRLREALVEGRLTKARSLWLAAGSRWLPPLSIHIDKRIPVAAGLAGGSANAAAALIGANEVWELGLGREQLAQIGVDLGADVPFCLLGGTAVARGIGEQLTPAPDAPPLAGVVATPNLRVATAEVYARYDEWFGSDSSDPDEARRRTEAMLAAVRSGDPSAVAVLLFNALEPVTTRLHPEVAQLREELLRAGALGAVMCGSGPSVFGLAEDERHAQLIRARLKRPGLFVESVRFIGAGDRIVEKGRRS